MHFGVIMRLGEKCLHLYFSWRIVVWCKDPFQLNNSFRGNGSLAMEELWKCGNKEEVIIVNAYSPCDFEGKRKVWQELKNYKIFL